MHQTDFPQRAKRGETTGRPPAAVGRSGQILRANVLTPFNFQLGALAGVVLATGAWQDALFGLVVVANSLIGVVQEVRPSARSTGWPCCARPGPGWCATARPGRSPPRTWFSTK